MPNPFNPNPPRKSFSGPEGEALWTKIGICLALVVAVVLVGAIVVHIARHQQNPADNSADNLPMPAPATNGVPELPPEVTAALANPTNLPEDVTPASASPAPATPTTYPPVATGPVVVAPAATVPVAPAMPVTKSRATVHYRPVLVVVRRGDTLWHIARTHHTTVRALKAANGLHSDLIRVGQKLKVPHSRAFVATRAHHRVLRHHGIMGMVWHQSARHHRRRR
jgi:LysM repeat protein